MKQLRLVFVIVISALFYTSPVFAQTSWTGATSVNWATPANWTAGVPTATTNAIIGDASFTGAFQPTISATATCKSLTIGGSVTAILTVGKTLTANGDISISSNGSLVNGAASISLTGSWINSGTYSVTSSSATVIFSGLSQTLGGSVVTTFRKLTINSGSTVTLASNVVSAGTSSIVSVSGTLNPAEAPGYQLAAENLTVNSKGVLRVNAASFIDNYTVSTLLSLPAGSIVDYGSTTANQTVSSNYTYSTLRISGSGVKSLSADLPALLSTSSSVGYVYVLGGTFDLASYMANRGTTVAGGSFSVSNGAALKIGGINTFPSGYGTNSLSLASTVEYNGANQSVSSKTYGNLIVSSNGGAVIKTMPATTMTVAGNFTSTVDAGTGVFYTAAAAINVTGTFTIGANTTFDGSSFTHSVTGNWVNNGTFTSSTSTINLKGANASIGGSGAHVFNNLTISASGISAASSINITVNGNLTTSGSGAFTHAAPGVLTMAGTTKTITGTGIVLNDLIINGIVTTANSFTLTGNLTINGSLTASGGTITMNGSGKTISGAGTMALKGLLISGAVTTASNFGISASLNVSGTFIASAGTATFTGSSTITGTPNLYNVTENGTSLILASNAVLGVANAFTFTAGSLNVTSYLPNTVNYNGTGAQIVSARPYNNLILSNGNTKTAGGAVTVNSVFTVGAGTTFSAVTYLHTLAGNLVNNGTLTAGTSTFQFTGAANTTISGAATFNIITINKTNTTNSVALLSNISVATINMTKGNVLTGSYTLTITTTRSGSGIILGTITRTHSFVTATAYAFEGANNTIAFTAVSGVSSVTVSVVSAPVADFPFGGSINRYYTVSVPLGTYTATLRLHYEDDELSGNDESLMQLWKYSGSAWGASGKTANSITLNYVEKSAITNLNDRWSCTDDGSVLSWNGSVDGDWSNGGNWSLVHGTFSGAPTSTDIVQIGTTSFANQPTIATTVAVKSIQFGSVQGSTLNLAAGGSLTTNGNISGSWSSNATHTINTNAQNMTINGDMVLSDNIPGHEINLNIGTGTVATTGSVVQSGGASIVFSGAGIINIGKDFLYSSGTFTEGTGTVRYNGTSTQSVAGVNYYNLTVTKATGIATLSSSTTVNGSLSVTAGQLNITSNTSVAGTVSISAGATLDVSGITLSVGGNWSRAGTFNAGTGVINMNGAGTQSISATTFNTVNITKPSGTATLTGNAVINGDMNVAAGTFSLSTFTANHGAPGGSFTVADGATLVVSGAANFPTNYTTYTLTANSLVHYNGTVAQLVEGIGYGNLMFSNGAVDKTLEASATVAGDVTINSSASFNAASFTLSLHGNWVNSGAFVPATGEIILNGTGKLISGTTTFNDVTVNGSYMVDGSDITYNGLLHVSATGSYASGAGTATVNGDLTNNGALTSTGTTTFTGTALQTIRLINALVSTSTGVVNFNGSVSPVLNSISTPTFATLNISNTGGVNPSVGWNILGPFTVNSGASFNGGASTHIIAHAFTNNGTVTSNGVLNFNTAPNVILQTGSSFSSTGTVIFGGAGQVTISGTPASLQNVIIGNTNVAGISPLSGWTINGDFSINSNASFHAGSYTYTVGGSIESDGLLDGQTSTFVMTSAAGNVTGSPATTFNHFTVNGNITAASDFNVAGDFTNNGTFDGSIGAVIMTGNQDASIKGTTAPSAIAQLTIRKTGATVTAMVNISSVINLNIASGTFFTSTNTITQDAGGGVLIVMSAAILKLGGTNTLPAFSGYGLDEQSLVDYAGTAQTVSNSAIYGHLKISAAGNKTAVNFLPLTIMGDFLLTDGNFIAGNNTHKIAGNFTMTGGSFNNTASTIMLNGTQDQAITSLSPFNNLTINKAAGFATLASDISVSSGLNFSLGKMMLGNHNLTIATSGSITGASSSKYIIADGIGTLIQQVAAGTAKVFPVGLTAVYAPATITLTAGSVTDNFTMRLLPGVYPNGASGTPLTTGIVNATWVINETVAGGSNATVTLQWPASLEAPGFQRTMCMHQRYTGTAWDYGTSILTATGSNPYSVSRSGFAGFTYFSVTVEDVLPVKWLTISGRNNGGANYIYWSTASEKSNSYFVVEASANGTSFFEAGRVSAKSGNSIQHYDFTHRDVAAPRMFYRIKQVDDNGAFYYSPIVIISGSERVTDVSFAPNPLVGNGAVSLQLKQKGIVQLSVFDAGIRLVQQQKLTLPAGSHSIPLDLHEVPAGIYWMRLIIDGELQTTIRIVKQ